MTVYLKENFGGTNFCQNFFVLHFSYVNIKYPSRKIVQCGIAYYNKQYTVSKCIYYMHDTRPNRKTSLSEKGSWKVPMYEKGKNKS